MDFSLLTTLPPPEFLNQGFNFIAKGDWKLEATHGIGRYCLDDCLEEHFPASLREELLFPTLKLRPNPFLNVPEACLLVFSY